MFIFQRAYYRWALFFLCPLVGCTFSSSTEKSISKAPVQAVKIIKKIKNQVASKKNGSEEKEINNLLKAAIERKRQQEEAEKTAAEFHYHIAIKLFKGLAQEDKMPSNHLTILNRSREHIVQCLTFQNKHKKAWKLLYKIDSYLGQPSGIEKTLLERASQKRQSEEQQKCIETQIKLHKAEKLTEAEDYEKALREFEKLRRVNSE